MYIRNASRLIENGATEADMRARKFCLKALESALAAVEPASLIRQKVRVTADYRYLVIDKKRVDLERFGRVLVIGGGKASAGMARALEEVLGDRITAGAVNVPESQVRNRKRYGRIKLHGATHPLPSAKGEEGVREMLGLIGRPTEDTLVICLISGGGSALIPMPREGVSLSDKIETTKVLLKAGATITELNTVRKHLSALKGGLLAAKLYPATVISLVISDVVGNKLDSIASGPLYPDPSTFADAIDVLKRYRVWTEIPANVRRLMERGTGGSIPDTPKPGSRYFERVTNVIIGSNEDACSAAMLRLKSLNCKPILVTTSYEGESKEVGMRFGALPTGLRTRPKSWVAGGETTVTVQGSGLGGRNQEFALGAALKIAGNQGVAVASMGTDGTDGPTDAAGAVVDGATTRRAGKCGLEPKAHLQRNDSYAFFKALGDLIMTGPTGTNVNDICVIVAV